MSVERELLKQSISESKAIKMRILLAIMQCAKFIVTENGGTVFAVTIKEYKKGSHQRELLREVAKKSFGVRYREDLEAVLSRYVGSSEFAGLDENLEKNKNLRLDWTTQEIVRLDVLEAFLSNIRTTKVPAHDWTAWATVFVDILDQPEGIFPIGVIDGNWRHEII